jgi:hypothetical protein
MAAIYMWPLEFKLVLTTTPYPVDVTDRLVFGATLNTGFMSFLPTENVQGSADVVSGYYEQHRWFYEDGPYLDDVEASADVVSGYYEQHRWFYEDGPYLDDVQASADVVGIGWYSYLVQVKTGSDQKPYEELQLSCTINDTCSMTGI